MPQMGVSVTEGTVIAWKVDVGAKVDVDQTVCEISTDKVDSEVPSPVSGTLIEILVSVGETVPVGTVLGRIATGAEGRPAPPRLPTDAEGPAARPRSYSPVVRRMAEAHGIDLGVIEGSGRGGRVTKRDVVALIAEQETPSNIVRPESPAVVNGEAQRLSRMRRSIAEHMTRSLATAAHCHTYIEVDMGSVEKVRRELGVSPLPIVAAATVRALREHPRLNAWIEDEMYTVHSEVHLGIAVSLGEDGLIVPVVHNAHELSVEGLDTTITELARKARSGDLSPDEVRGATFTITNLGGYGTVMSTPIINQPQVAILDLQAIVRRPVVVCDAIAIRPTTVLGLGWDHRALDGAAAAQFLSTMREQLESWA